MGCAAEGTLANRNAHIKKGAEMSALGNMNHAYSKGTDKKPHSETVKATLQKSFPGAFPGNVVESKTYEKLAKLGFNADNTLFTDCSCPDEVNHDDPTDDISTLFINRWGEVFPLGGLAGLPFTGKTGWGAFSSHCP